MKSLCFALFLSGCLALALAESQCEEHRARELATDTEVKLVPKCDENGDYEALQCFEGSPFCMCWRPDGSHITDPSRKITTCKCHVHLDEARQASSKGMVGGFAPTCNEEGTYAKLQCHGSTGFCWCADLEGNEVSEQIRGHPKC